MKSHIVLKRKKDIFDYHLDFMMLQGTERKAELGWPRQRLWHRHLRKALGVPLWGVFSMRCRVHVGLASRCEISPQKCIQAQTASLWQVIFVQFPCQALTLVLTLTALHSSQNKTNSQFQHYSIPTWLLLKSPCISQLLSIKHHSSSWQDLKFIEDIS